MSGQPQSPLSVGFLVAFVILPALGIVYLGLAFLLEEINPSIVMLTIENRASDSLVGGRLLGDGAVIGRIGSVPPRTKQTFKWRNRFDSDAGISFVLMDSIEVSSGIGSPRSGSTVKASFMADDESLGRVVTIDRDGEHLESWWTVAKSVAKEPGSGERLGGPVLRKSLGIKHSAPPVAP